MLKNIWDLSPPSAFKITTFSGFYKEVIAKVENWATAVTETVMDTEKCQMTPGVKVYGKVAVRTAWKEFKKNKDAGNDTVPDTITTLRRFSWLLSAEELAAVNKFVKQFVDKQQGHLMLDDKHKKYICDGKATGPGTDGGTGSSQ